MAYSLDTIEAQLAASEAQVPALRPGCEKKLIWAKDPGEMTDWSIAFLHGFSASGGELRPLPDLVAQGLGANLFFGRLKGHGRDGAAMADDTLADWRADVDETLAIGKLLGRRTLVVACSTGCTLAVDALSRGQPLDACCFVSPNFGLRNKLAQLLLDLPGSHRWVPRLIGRDRRFEVTSPAHAQFWTTRYPTRSVRPMAEVIRAVRRVDLCRISVPLFMALNERDKVIAPREAHKVMQRWGGDTELHELTQTAADDTNGHVMAGDVFSPQQTKPLAETILRWARNL